MKKEDISALMASVTLLVLLKTLVWAGDEENLEEDWLYREDENKILGAERVSDIENEFFQADIYDEHEEEETEEEIEQDQEFMEWLQQVVHKMNDGLEVLVELVEEEEEPIAEAASDSDGFGR